MSPDLHCGVFISIPFSKDEKDSGTTVKVTLEPGQFCSITLHNLLKGKDGASVEAHWNIKSEITATIYT